MPGSSRSFRRLSPSVRAAFGVGGVSVREIHKRLRTYRTFDSEQVELNEKRESADVRHFCRAL